MDRSWMNLPLSNDLYQNGVQFFLSFAFSNSDDNLILCPCKRCKNAFAKERKIVESHLLNTGFLEGYTKWVVHGELFSNNVPLASSSGGIDRSDDMHGLLYDAFQMPDGIDRSENVVGDISQTEQQIPNEEARKFYKILKDAEQDLYPGCKTFSKLSFIVRMLQLKCLGKWSDKSFSMMLDLLREAFPEGVQLPKNYYEAKKTMKDLGLNYKKIDSCRNDCMIYWGVNESKTKCDSCGEERWNITTDVGASKKQKKENKVAVKTFWHFPLKPRLQRLFMTSRTASLMTWHAKERTEDGFMRHPADSPAWKTFDYTHPEFAKEPRNVRLGLSSDGFSPYRSMNITHSTWPVILIPYNLPPGECMRQSYFMLSILIPGPSEPGNDIDVYLEPLIAELKELWDVGVETYDVSTKQNFQLRAAVLWTISDLPGLANLSGWSTRGKYACPVCGKNTKSEFLKNSHKHCYMCHRVFLPNDHSYRSDKRSFDGNEEHRCAPAYPRGSEVLDEIKNIENKFGKATGGSSNLSHNWKKKSIFFDLPYWESNLLRHNLDVMHIEKNVCDKVLYTLLDSDKSKDNKNARLDLKSKGIRPELHPFLDENGKEWLPASCFTFDKHEKKQLCKVLKDIKVPDGYAADISKCVHLKPPRIFGLKSHDSHILMQQLLPIALRKLLPSSVRSPLIHLCRFFRDICSKTLHHRDLTRMEKEIALILCQLEKIFPPAFFDITVHLTVHLVYEAKLAGPVHYRWMYPIERYLSTLKSYVRNKGRPEGSIAEGYLAEECLAFCSLYLNENVETRFNQVARNDEGGIANVGGLEIFSRAGCPLWNGAPIVFENETLDKAHRYVLFNCDEIIPYRNQHEAIVRHMKYRSSVHEIKRIHSRDFPSWFFSQGDMVQSDIKCLARGPVHAGNRYKGFKINGFRFHTKEIERKRKTQNCGVMVSAATTSFASKKDRRPILSDLSYYGILKAIIELDYTGGRRVVLFECDWVSKGRRLKQDSDGFTLANFTNIKRHNEPFVLASQVKQVFYVEDPSDKGWHVVVKTKARDKFEDGKDTRTSDLETILLSEPCNEQPINEIDDVSWNRDGVPPTPVD